MTKSEMRQEIVMLRLELGEYSDLFDLQHTRMKDCPLCRGRGVYTALHVGEYHDLPMSMKCACTNGGKKK